MKLHNTKSKFTISRNHLKTKKKLKLWDSSGAVFRLRLLEQTQSLKLMAGKFVDVDIHGEQLKVYFLFEKNKIVDQMYAKF